MKKQKLLETIYKLLLLAVTLGVLSNEAISQAQKITLDDAIDIALKNNPDIRIGLMEIEKADAAVSEAYGYAYPSLDISANFSHFIAKPKMPFPDFGALLNNQVYKILDTTGLLSKDELDYKDVKEGLSDDFFLSNTYEAKAEVTQILFNSAVFEGIGAAGVYLNTVREQLNGKVSETVMNVKQAFYGVLLTKEMLEITKSTLENAEKNLSNVNAFLKQGLVSEYDAMQAEVRVENIRPVIQQLENSHMAAMDGLKMTLGIDPTEEIEVIGKLEYVDEELPSESNLISQSKKGNHTLKTLEQKQTLDEALIDIDRSDYWPTIAAFGNYSYAGMADDLNFQNYSSGIVGLSFSMNLFKGMQTSHRVQQKKIQYDQTGEQIEQLKDALTMQIKAGILELKRVKESINAQDRNISLAQKAYDISLVRYKEGEGNQLEIQNADMALQQAKTNKLQSVFDYLKAKADLDNLTGNVDRKHLRSVK